MLPVNHTGIFNVFKTLPFSSMWQFARMHDIEAFRRCFMSAHPGKNRRVVLLLRQYYQNWYRFCTIISSSSKAVIQTTSNGERALKVKENRRSGIDRRDLDSDASEERREGAERRVILCQQIEYLQILEKIPIFRGLTPKQASRILKICSKRNVAKDEIICSAGDESNEIYILIKGLLGISFHKGKELSRIKPVGIVGEMGVFTGERRSANVSAMSDSIILVIHKAEILKLFRYDSDLKTHILH